AALGTAAATETEIEREAGLARYPLAGERLAEDFQDDVHGHQRPARLRVAASIVRKQCRERRMDERVQLEDLELRRGRRRTARGEQRVDGTHEGGRNDLPAVGAHVRYAIRGDANLIEGLVGNLARI